MNRIDNSRGSGVLISKTDDRVYILTAAHIVKDRDLLDVACYRATKGQTVRMPALVVAKSQTQDLALLQAFTKMSGLPKPLAIFDRNRGNFPLPFETVFFSYLGDLPQAYTTQVVRDTLVQRPDSESAVRMWVADQEPLPGQSGGPMVDPQGVVLGMASGASAGQGYFVHIDEIRTFLQTTGVFEFLESPAE